MFLKILPVCAVLALACSGCSVVSATASVASAGVSVAAGTVKLGARAVGAGGRAIFRKSKGKCYASDQGGGEVPIECPKGA